VCGLPPKEICDALEAQAKQEAQAWQTLQVLTAASLDRGKS